MTASLAVGAVLGGLEIIGVILVSYGLLRESFATLANERGFGEGRFGEGTFGGSLSGVEQRLVSLGIRLRLLPTDGELTLTDRKRNAAASVGGVSLVLVVLLVRLLLPFV